jgi:hypothetical protein
VCTITLVALFVSLVTGAGVDPGAALSDGVRVAFGVFGLLVVGNIVVSLVDWLRAMHERSRPGLSGAVRHGRAQRAAKRCT